MGKPLSEAEKRYKKIHPKALVYEFRLLCLLNESIGRPIEEVKAAIPKEWGEEIARRT